MLAACAPPTVREHRLVWYAEGAKLMKAKKALKRLAKIKALISDVTERYSASAPHLREVLHEATAAIGRATEAVSLQVSSRTKAATAKAVRGVKKATSSRKKAVVKRVVANAPRVMAAKKSTPIKKAAKKRAAKRTGPVPVVVATPTKVVAQ